MHLVIATRAIIDFVIKKNGTERDFEMMEKVWEKVSDLI